MFRVIDVAGLFQELGNTNFNNQNAVLDITILDTFYPQNNKTTTIEFVNGCANVGNSTSSKNRIEIRLDISDFSSLIMGSINAKSLYRLGLLKISDERMLELVESIFLIEQKPLCTVHI
jgi:predicted acetyltransferase